MDAARTVANDSEFYMWRAVLAYALYEGVLSLEAQAVLRQAMGNVKFSSQQKKILRADLSVPQDIDVLHRHISDPRDKERFFKIIHALRSCRERPRRCESPYDIYSAQDGKNRAESAPQVQIRV